MPPAAQEVDPVTGEAVEVGSAVAISPAERAAIDTQIATAKRYPRSIKAVRDMAMSMATSTEEVAASCCYSLKRQGKAIKGPSVRLAEIMVQAWGNIRAGTRVLAADHLTVEAESVCWDLERNVAISAAVKRRITGKDGRRYNDDMVVTTGNAAASVAFRNAVFRVIPKTFVHEVYDACERTAVGDIKTLAQRRASALEYFARFGVTAEQICRRMERESVDQLTLDDVAELKAMAEAVRRGDETIDGLFAEPKAEPAAPKSATTIADEVEKQMDEALNRGKSADGSVPQPAAEAPPSPEEEERRAETVRKLTGCRKDLPGCSDQISPGPDGKPVCLNHLPSQGATTDGGGQPAAQPSESLIPGATGSGGSSSPGGRRSRR